MSVDVCCMVGVGEGAVVVEEKHSDVLQVQRCQL